MLHQSIRITCWMRSGKWNLDGLLINLTVYILFKVAKRPWNRVLKLSTHRLLLVRNSLIRFCEINLDLYHQRWSKPPPEQPLVVQGEITGAAYRPSPPIQP